MTLRVSANSGVSKLLYSNSSHSDSNRVHLSHNVSFLNAALMIEGSIPDSLALSFLLYIY